MRAELGDTERLWSFPSFPCFYSNTLNKMSVATRVGCQTGALSLSLCLCLCLCLSLSLSLSLSLGRGGGRCQVKLFFSVLFYFYWCTSTSTDVLLLLLMYFWRSVQLVSHCFAGLIDFVHFQLDARLTRKVIYVAFRAVNIAPAYVT